MNSTEYQVKNWLVALSFIIVTLYTLLLFFVRINGRYSKFSGDPAMLKGIIVVTLGLAAAAIAGPVPVLQSDTITTDKGPLIITFVGHGSLIFAFNSTVVHVDPFGKLTDYVKLPKADIILITHEHSDHLDTNAVAAISTEKTALVYTQACFELLKHGAVMKNGDAKTVAGIGISAVAAYNLIHKRDDGRPFHPKGSGNGYVLIFGNKKVYVAGDTENIPEIKTLKNIDIAFLPVNLPYTMTPVMAGEAVRSLMPKIVYPYHFGETDTAQIRAELAEINGVEVQIRNMK